MSLKIIDIVNTPELKTSFLAGENGSDNVVNWAHVCELKDPTEWYGDGHLIMTTGIGIPKSKKEQENYIVRLSQANLSGIAIGKNMQAPADISALINKAESLDFPVLITDYGIPFSSISHLVVESDKREELQQQNALKNIFISARMAIEGLNLNELLLRLSKDIDAEIMLYTAGDDDYFIYPQTIKIPDELKNTLSKKPFDFSEYSPSIKKYNFNNKLYYAVAVPVQKQTILFVSNADYYLLRYSLIHNLVSVVSIAIEHQYSKAERHLRLGSQFLDDIIQSRMSPYEINNYLNNLDIELKNAVIAISKPEKLKLIDWQLQFIRKKIKVIARQQGEDLILLLDSKAIEEVQKILCERIGVSNIIEDYSRLHEAHREARLAHIHTKNKPLVLYEQIYDKVPWVPETLDDAAQVFQRVLGDLYDYDDKQNIPLLYSLKIFLENNRSWTLASKALHVHRTTLIYRMNKVESITGRSLNNTEDITVLWLAIKAGEIAGLI